MRELWTEKYRPKVVSDYVFKNEHQKEQVLSWIKHKSIPHLLLSGSPGVGKTTLAKVLLNEIGADQGDILEMNSSSERGIDEIRDTITAFASMMPYGDFKYILLDEADYLTPPAQAALRNVMETYSNFTRFILTCNYPHKIIPAIHSRCQSFHIDNLDRTEFTARMADILIKENIELSLETLDMFVGAAYPDLRKCINLCQQNSQTGVLKMPEKDSDSSSKDFKLEMFALFKAKKYKQARELICKQASYDEYEEIYRFMYDNLELWGNTDEQISQAIVIIRNGLVKDTMCADREINLSATICELSMIN